MTCNALAGRWILLAPFTALLFGCARSPIPAVAADPYALSDRYPPTLDYAYTVEDAAYFQGRLQYIRDHIDSQTDTRAKQWRNEFLALKMATIDSAYRVYEERLTHDDSAINLSGTLASLGLTTAASLVPAAQTGKVLSATATAVTGATAAYDKDILLSQTIQALQTQMRADRTNIAIQIQNKMSKCDLSNYPMGLVYSDLAAYERAGTLSSALIGINKTVTNAANAAERAKARGGGARGPDERAAALAQVPTITSSGTECPIS
jgi:hypothetical protein